MIKSCLQGKGVGGFLVSSGASSSFVGADMVVERNDLVTQICNSQYKQLGSNTSSFTEPGDFDQFVE